jgi:hypothetical protein
VPAGAPDNLSALLGASRAFVGAGVAMLPTFLVDDALTRRALRVVLPQ